MANAPLHFEKIGHALQDSANTAPWKDLADRLLERGFSGDRVHNYYIPLLIWCDQTLKAHHSKARPMIIGLSGAQGSGKTTLTATLIEMCGVIGLNAASVSVDDFYLTRQEQVALAASFPENPYLQQRGYPGTHDISLGIKTLHSLKNLNDTCEMSIPVYDKSQHRGQGDRLPETAWQRVRGPLDLVFFEGWMLGFRPVPKDRLPNDSLLEINRLLANYLAWYEYMDALIILRPCDLRFVIEWRVEAEERMKAQGRAGLSSEEIRTYIHKFIPAYETYLPTLEGQAPKGRPCLVLTLNKNRLPIVDGTI